MAYKKSIFKDKTVITLSTISIIAAAALIGGIALDSGSKDNSNKNQNIVDLNEEDTRKNDSGKIADKTPISETEEFANLDNTKSTEEITTVEETTTPAAPEISVNATTNKLTFNNMLTWPVDGNIVIDYDMENTVYFPTLDLYKCSDAICIQSEIDTPVYASGTCIVKEIGTNDEIGSFVTVDLGSDFSLTYGQLKDVVIDADSTLEAGDLIGYINEPSDYYSVEGPNLYMKLTENGSPVNPLDYLDYE